MGKALLAGVALALASTGTAAASPAGTAPPAPDGPQARVWVSTVDRSQLLTEAAPVTFGRGSSAEPTIVVDPERAY